MKHHPKLLKLIYKALLAGVTYREIGEVFGVNKVYVNRYAIKHGIWNKLENKRLKGLEELKKEVKKLSSV